MSVDDLKTIEIPAQALTREDFAPFGDVISKDGLERLPIDIYGDAANVYVPSDFESDQPTEFLLTNCRLREFRVLFMERHVELTRTRSFRFAVTHSSSWLRRRNVPRSTECRRSTASERSSFPVPARSTSSVVPGMSSRSPWSTTST